MWCGFLNEPNTPIYIMFCVS